MSNTIKDLAAGTAGGIAQVRYKIGSILRVDSTRVSGPRWTTLRHCESGESGYKIPARILAYPL
jgi:hypothetical protein